MKMTLEKSEMIDRVIDLFRFTNAVEKIAFRKALHRFTRKELVMMDRVLGLNVLGGKECK